MKLLISIAVSLLALLTMPAWAQSSYDTGYNRGYNDIFPSAGAPSGSSDFARGFRAGQDDADDDDQEMLRRVAPPSDDRALRRLPEEPACGMFSPLGCGHD